MTEWPQDRIEKFWRGLGWVQKTMRPLTTRELAEKYGIKYDKREHAAVYVEHRLLDPYGFSRDWPDDVIIESRQKFRAAGYNKTDAEWATDRAALVSNIDNLWISAEGKVYDELPNPHDLSAPLEVLHEGLERLIWEQDKTAQTAANACLDTEGKPEYWIMGWWTCRNPDRRTAIIAAIEKLLEAREVEDGP